MLGLLIANAQNSNASATTVADGIGATLTTIVSAFGTVISNHIQLILVVTILGGLLFWIAGKVMGRGRGR